MPIQPLAGVHVLDLTALPPGGYCTVQLADLGADVIRVESPGQAGRPSTVIGEPGLSRGKRSITLDQRNPRANEVLARLAGWADVLVENARPGAMASRGFGYPQASEVAPRLVWCSITGFGQDGPYADRSGHDLSYLGYSGVLAALSPELAAGKTWHPGAMLSVPIAGMTAVTGILAALIERGKTGRGAHVDISLAESASWLLSGASAALADGYAGLGEPPDRRLYRCSDGRYISVAAAEPRTWAALAEGLGMPDLVAEQGSRAPELQQRLDEVFATRSANEWTELLGPLGAAVNPVNIGADLAADAHASERGSVLTVQGRSVPVDPVRLTTASDRSETVTSEPGLVGADTDTVLAEAGFSADQISALRADAVI